MTVHRGTSLLFVRKRRRRWWWEHLEGNVCRLACGRKRLWKERRTVCSLSNARFKKGKTIGMRLKTNSMNSSRSDTSYGGLTPTLLSPFPSCTSHCFWLVLAPAESLMLQLLRRSSKSPSDCFSVALFCVSLRRSRLCILADLLPSRQAYVHQFTAGFLLKLSPCVLFSSPAPWGGQTLYTEQEITYCSVLLWPT